MRDTLELNAPQRDIIRIDTRPLWWLERKRIGLTRYDFICARDGEVKIQSANAMLLELFVEKPEIDGVRTITKAELDDFYFDPDSNALDVQISRLRKILNDHDALPVTLNRRHQPCADLKMIRKIR